MFANKPVIGIAGGIGSGKSFAAKLLGEMGCLVIQSDALVHQAYQTDAVKRTLAQWWGPRVLDPAGNLNRSAIAGIIFNNPDERKRLEGLIHPLVEQQRQNIMTDAASRPEIVAFVWDVPLLFETGLNRQCDAVIFVDAPETVRDHRLAVSRGWNVAERKKRENLQMPLDKKKEMSDYIVSNTSGETELREHVRDVLNRILGQFAFRPESE